MTRNLQISKQSSNLAYFIDRYFARTQFLRFSPELCRGRTLKQWETILIAPGKSGKGECLWAETFCGT